MENLLALESEIKLLERKLLALSLFSDKKPLELFELSDVENSPLSIFFFGAGLS